MLTPISLTILSIRLYKYMSTWRLFSSSPSLYLFGGGPRRAGADSNESSTIYIYIYINFEYKLKIERDGTS